MKTAIFLGGGASAAEGAPVQAELFSRYFHSYAPLVKGEKLTVMDEELAAYFYDMFGIDIAAEGDSPAQYPTFEEALGLLDLAVRRREAFQGYDLENVNHSSNRIGFIRQYLVLLLATVLSNTPLNGQGLHQLLIDNLRHLGHLDETVFITTNYDLLLDTALGSLNGYRLDYGFTTDGARGITALAQNTIQLYKIHGSLNWLYCPACNAIVITKREAGVLRLLSDRRHSDCQRCSSIMLPVVVPPTYFKDMSNIYLNIVWQQAEQVLRKVGRIIFCGYSFPDADMHVKYLLKRAQVNRDGELQIVIVNHHPGKSPDRAEDEKNRYRRFLGMKVFYSDCSFRDFAENPAGLLQ